MFLGVFVIKEASLIMFNIYFPARRVRLEHCGCARRPAPPPVISCLLPRNLIVYGFRRALSLSFIIFCPPLLKPNTGFYGKVEYLQRRGAAESAAFPRAVNLHEGTATCLGKGAPRFPQTGADAWPSPSFKYSRRKSLFCVIMYGIPRPPQGQEEAAFCAVQCAVGAVTYAVYSLSAIICNPRRSRL